MAGALDLETYVFGGQEAQHPLRNERLARRPTLEGQSPGEAAECPFLGGQVGEANSDQKMNLSVRRAVAV
jgi:hypothetical protein